MNNKSGRRRQRIVSKNQVITTGLDELIEVSLNITANTKKDISSSTDKSTQLSEDNSDSKNDSQLNSSNNDMENLDKKVKDKEDLQNLINQIAGKNIEEDNNKENNIVIKNGKKMKQIKSNEHDERNNKALATLRGCTQMKQLKIALEIYNKLKKDGIKINKYVQNELIRISLQCNDLESASIILKEMDRNKFAADRDLLDKFVELQAKNPPNNQNKQQHVSINNTFNQNHQYYNYNSDYYNNSSVNADQYYAPVMNYQPQYYNGSYAYNNEDNYRKDNQKYRKCNKTKIMNPDATEFMPQHKNYNVNVEEFVPKNFNPENVLKEKIDN